MVNGVLKEFDRRSVTLSDGKSYPLAPNYQVLKGPYPNHPAGSWQPAGIGLPDLVGKSVVLHGAPVHTVSPV